MTAFVKSMAQFEAWTLAKLGPLVDPGGLADKRARMAESPLGFLRACYWRWAETILEVCPDLADAPAVLAVGDVHVENFGTWRDVEGRLVWGLNDFDDAAMMPYALDLVRLCASALLARDSDGPRARQVCAAVLAGYRAGLAAPQPVVLERDLPWLRAAVRIGPKERAAFWEKLAALPPGPVAPPLDAALAAALPGPGAVGTVVPRRAGTGSLGRARALWRGTWAGGPVLREAKAMLPSAWARLHAPDDTAIRALAAATAPGRLVDPWLRLEGTVLVRRLSPSNRKIDARTDPGLITNPRLLRLMGGELALSHRGDPAATGIDADLARRDPDWLRTAAKTAAAFVAGEHADFAAAYTSSGSDGRKR